MQNIYVTFKIGSTILANKVSIAVDPTKDIIPVINGTLNQLADDNEIRNTDIIDYEIHLTI